MEKKKKKKSSNTAHNTQMQSDVIVSVHETPLQQFEQILKQYTIK